MKKMLVDRFSLISVLALVGIGGLGLIGCAPDPNDDGPTVSKEEPTRRAVATTSSCTVGAIVAINSSDQNLYRWTRSSAISGGFTAADKVGKSWASIKLIASDSATGDLYALHQNGNLYHYWYQGTGYTGGTLIKQGLENLRQLISAGDGILYAVGDDGALTWYHWTSEGLTDNSGAQVGSGWGGLTIFSGGNGIIYAIVQSTGELRWYRHLEPFGGTPSWLGPRSVGSGWQNMRWTSGLGSGVIYAVNESGSLLYYEHTGYADGSRTWFNGGKAQTIGSGWQNYRNLTTNPNACPTETAGSSTHLWTDCPEFYGSTLRGKSFTGHGQTVAVDDAGRPWYATRTWGGDENPAAGGRQDTCQGQVGLWGTRGDVGGHLIPDAAGGWGGRANLVPQNGSMNNSVWKTVEATLSRCIASGYEVQYGVTASYPDIDDPRPSELNATLYVIAGDQELSASVTMANRAPTALEQQKADSFRSVLYPACSADYVQFYDSRVSEAVSFAYWGATEPAVEYTKTAPVQVRVLSGDGTAHAIKLQRCSAGCDAAVDAGFSDVTDSATTGSPRSLWMTALRFSEYRACRQSVAGGDWKCMRYSVNLGN